MAFSSIILQFTEVPPINEYIEFIEESVGPVTIKETIKVNRTAIKQVKRPVSYDLSIEGDPPFYIFSGWISENYKTAFNLDYNPGGTLYDVVCVNDAAGTGTGTVTITAKFLNAVFITTNIPDGVIATVNNEEVPETIYITDVATTAADENPCENVEVSVSTNVLATKVLAPEVIDPNTDNPFTVIVPRGAPYTVTVQDVDENEVSQTYDAPALLVEGDFTVTVENDLTGATVTIAGAPAGLTLQYAIDGGAFQDSNVFTGLAPGVYSAVIKDQYGCAIGKAFTVEEILTPIILSRSPYFSVVEAPGVPFDAATLNLRVWAGNVIADRPAAPTWSLSKIAVQAGQSKIVFDLHHIINDFVKNWYTHFVQGVGAFTVSSRDTVFVETQKTATYLDDVVGTDSRRYLAVDGFGRHIEGPNPILSQKVLSSITKHVFYGNNCPIHFITRGLTSIVVNGTDVPFTFTQDSNNQVIAYINAAAYAPGSTPFNAVFTYGDEVITHQFQKLTECKYAVATCYFKNKFGFYETIPFAKLSKKGIDSSSTDYEAAIADFDTYDVNKHVNRNFNIEVAKKITVNTDFIPEAYNALFEELMASEFIYLEQRGTCLPVNRSRGNWDEKTKTNDKLIQYTMEFKYSFNEINQVQ
jgi:hypothetical protein